jgi:hypothetical protein
MRRVCFVNRVQIRKLDRFRDIQASTGAMSDILWSDPEGARGGGVRCDLI